MHYLRALTQAIDGGYPCVPPLGVSGGCDLERPCLPSPPLTYSAAFDMVYIWKKEEDWSLKPKHEYDIQMQIR